MGCAGRRWKKSASELSLLRQSGDLSAQAIRKCMQASHPGVHEHHLAATFGKKRSCPVRLAAWAPTSSLRATGQPQMHACWN